MMGWDTFIYLMIASMVISAALAPKPATPQAPTAETLSEIDFPQADEGTPQCVIFGDCWTEDWMVLGVGNYRTTAIKSDSGGGK